MAAAPVSRIASLVVTGVPSAPWVCWLVMAIMFTLDALDFDETKERDEER